MIKRLFLLSCVAILGTLIKALPVDAVCPICTVAVGAGIGFSRWLGVDDIISGLWIGGLTVSLIVWTIDWLDRKQRHFWKREFLISLAYFALIVIPLYPLHILGTHQNLIWYIDKLLIGIAVGGLTFLAGATAYPYLKAKNGGKAHFPFEKIVLPIAPLILLTILFYFLTK